MELTDGVITLRPPVDADATRVAQSVRSSYAELAPFMVWATPDHDESRVLQWIRGEVGHDEHRYVIVDPDGELVGCTGLSQFSEINRFANLGYWVRTDATGRGIATRATVMLAAYGLRSLGLGRIEILMSAENIASRRVAERAGAHYEGRLRNRLLLHDRFHDADLYSIIP